MKKLMKKTAIFVAVGAMVASIGPSVYAQNVTSQNISGSDRYSTAVKISQSGWSQSDTVILTNANAVADSLSVAPLASKLRVPVLLTQSDSLNEATMAELSRLGAKKVLIIGGQDSISMGLEDNLKTSSLDVERIEGASREETSLNIAKKLKELTSEKFQVAFLVNGHKGLADAAGIGAIAAKKGAPILFTSNSRLEATRSDLGQLGIDNVYVIGGNLSLVGEFDRIATSVERIAGSNRQETSLKMMNKFNPNPAVVYLTDDGGVRANRLIDAVLINSGIIASNAQASASDKGVEQVGPTKSPKSSNLAEGAVLLVNSNNGLSFNQYKTLYNMSSLTGLTQVSGGDALTNSMGILSNLMQNKGNAKADQAFDRLMKLEYLTTEYNVYGTKKQIEGSQFLSTLKMDSSFNFLYDRARMESLLKNMDNKAVPKQLSDSYAYWKNGDVIISKMKQVTKMDLDYEVNRLSGILKSGVSTYNINPKYIVTNYGDIPANAVNLGHKYIEIDISQQKMWLMEYGYEKMVTPVVTGNPNKGMATPPGIFQVRKMMTNAVLRGPGYASPVKYWVPFNGSIGLHDAYWQPFFGGNRYLYAGSHGCVNTPLSNMSFLYSRIHVGTPVIVHK